MNALDAVILDLDGTMLDTTESLCSAVASAANQCVGSLNLMGPDILTKYPGLYGGPLDEFHDRIVVPHCPNLTDDDAHKASYRKFVDLFLEAVKSTLPSPLFADVLEALEKLRKEHSNLKIAVATTKPTRTAEGDLTSASVPDTLRPMLDAVQGTDPGMSPKPSPDVILAAASKVGADVCKTIYVGDTPRDSAAARAAGCVASLTVRRDGGKCRDKLGADWLISR